jgi:hypothetical protein
VAFLHHAPGLVEFGNAEWACAYAEFASDALFVVDDDGSFLEFRNGSNRARSGTCRLFAVHASPVEEAPFCLIGDHAVFQFELDVSVSIRGKLRRVCPFAAERCCLARTIIPPFAGNLAAPASDAFCRVN